MNLLDIITPVIMLGTAYLLLFTPLVGKGWRERRLFLPGDPHQFSSCSGNPLNPLVGNVREGHRSKAKVASSASCSHTIVCKDNAGTRQISDDTYPLLPSQWSVEPITCRSSLVSATATIGPLGFVAMVLSFLSEPLVARDSGAVCTAVSRGFGDWENIALKEYAIKDIVGRGVGR